MNPKADHEAEAVIPFPRRDDSQSNSDGNGDDLSRAVKIHELCRDTSLALQELRDGVLNVLYDIIDRRHLSPAALADVLDESASVIEELVDGDAEAITTETILHYLEALRPYW